MAASSVTLLRGGFNDDERAVFSSAKVSRDISVAPFSYIKLFNR